MLLSMRFGEREMMMMVMMVTTTTTVFAATDADDGFYLPSSDGGIVECIDILKQPSFQDELLRDHKLQVWPSHIPRSVTRPNSKWRTARAHISTADCPKGTIPLRVAGGTGVNKPNANVTIGHEYALRTLTTPPKLFGAKCKINVWKPEVEEGVDEFSISQIWVRAGDYDTDDLNTIEIGWQVYPLFYLDRRPRLFIYWTADSYKNGHYNLDGPGFIQISSRVVIGGAISPVSILDGEQFEIDVFIWKDPRYGNWWLILDDEPVGYWPPKIFTTLADYATLIDFGGEILNRHKFGRHTTTEMGSGRFPDEGFSRASYFRNIEYVDVNNRLQSIKKPLQTLINDPKLYDMKNLYRDDWGVYFFYGGPGNRPGYRALKSGADRPSLFISSLFILALFV